MIKTKSISNFECRIQAIDTKHFPLPLDVRWLGGKLWLLLTPFEYHRDNGEVYIADKGFITDFGSKPQVTWILVGSPTDEGGMAYVIHDDLCKKKPFPFPKIDRIFYEALRDSSVRYIKRTVMYWAVCVFHTIKS